MQEDTRLAFPALRLLTLTQEETEERRNLDPQVSALHLIGARGLECVLEHAAGEVTHIHLDGQCLREIAVECGNKDTVFLLLVEHIVARTDGTRIGNDIARTVERQDIACAQSIIFITNGDKALEPAANVLVAVLPIVGTAVERILEPLHPDLVAVVDTRYAGVGHLPERCHEKPPRPEVKLLVRHADA